MCVGCFSCWVRTPGVCAQPDQWSHMGRSIAACDRLWIVSRCLYGGPGPEVKALLDRSIPYMHPDFAIRGGEMHHKMRLDHHPDLRVLFYGDITQAERETAGAGPAPWPGTWTSRWSGSPFIYLRRNWRESCEGSTDQRQPQAPGQRLPPCCRDGA